MYWQRGLLLLGSEFDDVRVSNRCTAEINDAAVSAFCYRQEADIDHFVPERSFETAFRLPYYWS